MLAPALRRKYGGTVTEGNAHSQRTEGRGAVSTGVSSTIDDGVRLRRLGEADPPAISDSFAQIGWNKPPAQFQRYLAQQQAGHLICLVAFFGSPFAGYATVNWKPTYPGSVETNLPEIQDLNVLPQFRRRGIGTRLLDEAERIVALRSNAVAIGVGLHPGFNAAQRLYGKRGYVPDGRGVTYAEKFVEEGATVAMDDELVLHLIKQLR
jgi:GNAT superfamily N-acetyltransferase